MLAKFLAWKNCPLNSSKRSKTFVTGIDVLLNLPTGFGKSLVFQIALLVYASLRRNHDATMDLQRIQ